MEAFPSEGKQQIAGGGQLGQVLGHHKKSQMDQQSKGRKDYSYFPIDSCVVFIFSIIACCRRIRRSEKGTSLRYRIAQRQFANFLIREQMLPLRVVTMVHLFFHVWYKMYTMIYRDKSLVTKFFHAPLKTKKINTTAIFFHQNHRRNHHERADESTRYPFISPL